MIPIYQRTYSWTERECQQLWDDILRAGHNQAVSSHFIGSVVYVEQGLSQIVNESPLLVIDGQQRLTTASLILEALARRVGDDEPVDGFSAKKLRNYYLLNPEESGDRKFKLLLTQTDRDSLLALLQQKVLPLEHSARIEENFAFFEQKIAALGADLPAFCRGIAKLVVVDVALQFAALELLEAATDLCGFLHHTVSQGNHRSVAVKASCLLRSKKQRLI